MANDQSTTSNYKRLAQIHVVGDEHSKVESTNLQLFFCYL